MNLNATNGITLAARTMSIGGQTYVSGNGGVKSGGDLKLAGGAGDLTLLGTTATAGGNVALSTNGNINIAAVGNTTTRTKRDRRSKTTIVETTATGSRDHCGGSIAAEAGSNLNVVGSNLSAAGTRRPQGDRRRDDCRGGRDHDDRLQLQEEGRPVRRR